jgi:hypothetical protein
MKRFHQTESFEKMYESLTEAVFDAEGVIGKKRITKPMSAKSADDAEKQFVAFIKNQQKLGHVPNGKLTDIKIKGAGMKEAASREDFFKHMAGMMTDVTHQSLMGRANDPQTMHIDKFHQAGKTVKQCFATLPVISEESDKVRIDKAKKGGLLLENGKEADLKDDQLKKLYNQMKDERLSGSAAAQFKAIVREMKNRKISLTEETVCKKGKYMHSFNEMVESLGLGLEEGSTENAAKSLEAILGMFKDKHDNDIYKMGKGIQDHYKKEGSFSPDQAKWIWKTSVALFKK